MSEFDQNVEFILRHDDNEFVINPDNSAIYRFVGRTSIDGLDLENKVLNHIYVDEPENPQGLYFFKAFHPVHDKLQHHMVKQQYPLFINQRTVPEVVIEAYLNEVDEAAAKFVSELPDKL